MNILAFDTSSHACSVALLAHDEIHSLQQIAPMQHGKFILSMIQTLMNNASLDFAKLDALAYGCGPGSFTGIRMASSVAQGIGYITKCPIIPISSLAALAQTAWLEYKQPALLVAVDARMQQIYWACYEIKNDYAQLIDTEKIYTLDTIPNNIKNTQQWCGIGDAWGIEKDNLIKRMGFKPSILYSSLLPNGQALLKLAEIKLAQEEWVSSAHALPCYLR